MILSRVLGGLTAVGVGVVLAACGGGGGGGGSGSSSGGQQPVNRAPVAHAGADQSVFKAAAVTLTAAASSDPDGNTLSYRWTQTAGPSVSLSSTTVAQPTFAAPGASGTLTFSLVVNDGRVDSAADTVSVAITNRAPSANAGTDANVNAGVLHTLDALGSSDPDQDSLTYTWVQLAGPPVTLTAVAPGRARFSTPLATARLEFGVIANDGETTSAQDVVVVNVALLSGNVPPSAYVYAPTESPKRAVVSLNSYGWDPEGSPLRFTWTQTAGPTVTLADATTPAPSFTAPDSPATLTFELVVNDGSMDSEPVSVDIVVRNFAPQVNNLAVTPGAPRTNDNLVAAADVTDPDGDPVVLSYSWTRNGAAVPAVTGDTYPASLTTRDDEIVLTLGASDGSDTTSIDTSVVIEDTPPVIVAITPPTSVNYGDNVAFQVSVGPDPDGDVVGPFVLRLGPAGFAVDAIGAVTWEARLPMFDDHVDVAWSVGLRDHETAALTGTIRVNHAARQMPLVRSGVVAQTSRELIAAADMDLDGVAEIVVSNGRALSVLGKSGANYVEEWAYPFNLSGLENGVGAIAVANVSGDARPEIFTNADDTIRLLSGETRRETHQYTHASLDRCLVLRVADLEGDGSQELLCLAMDPAVYNGGGISIRVLNAADLTPKGRIDQSGLGSSMAVANVDNDAALEIVTANGFVYDGATLLNEWAYGPSFGQVVDAGDVDGDGIAEIAASGFSGAVRIFSAISRSPRWEITNNNCCSVNDVRLVDVNADGRREVLMGGGPSEGLSVWRLDVGTQQFSQVGTIPAQDYEVTGIAAGNLDADPAIEVIWATGIVHSGEDIMVVAEYTGTNNLTLEWTSESPGQFMGPFYGGVLAHTAPGVSRAIFSASSASGGLGGTRLFSLDPVTGGTTSSSELGSNWANANGIAVGDTDGDALDEVFLSSANLYDTFFSTYDFVSDSREWTSPAGFAGSMGIAKADFDGDGRMDFVTMGSDRRVSVFNVAQQNILFQSIQLTGSGMDVEVADLDNDGVYEIVALTSEYLYVFGRANNNSQFLERGNTAVVGGGNLLVADTDGDGEQEIFATVNTGAYWDPHNNIAVYDRQLTRVRTFELAESVTNLILEPGAGARKNLLVSTAGGGGSYWWTAATEIWAIDAATGAGVWRTPSIAGEFSRHSLHAADLGGDSTYELAFATNIGAMISR